MTHTLHRRVFLENVGQDFTLLCMAAQGYNDEGAGEKLKEVYGLVAAANPDNLADDNLGGRFTGYSDEQILDHMNDKAYIGAAFSDSDRLKEALQKIKETDLGMSVVITGNYQEVFEALKDVGLKPHPAQKMIENAGYRFMPNGKTTLNLGRIGSRES